MLGNTPLPFNYHPRFCMPPCDTVAKHQLPCMFYGSFKMFKVSTSELGTMAMNRRMRACADQFLPKVTESVVHSVYKVVTRLSFGVTQRHKVSACKWTFRHCVTNLTW